MATNNSRRNGCLMILGYYIAIITAVVLMLSSCTRQVYVPVESVTYRTDTLRLTEIRIDSVAVRDSVAVMQKGDTVYITKWHNKFKYINNTDTIYKAIIDTARIQVPYPIEKPLSRWQQTKMDIGGIAIGIIVLALCAAVVWIVRRWR